MDFFKLPRRKVRYWLFRFRTEAISGVPSNGAPDGLKAHFESQEGFKGWKNFAIVWDIPIGEPSEIVPLEIVPRKFSVWEEWNAEMRAEMRVHPGFDTTGQEREIKVDG